MTNDAMGKYRKEISRRRFLGLMGATGATAVAVSALGTRFAFATPEAPATGDVIVFVNLFGGADALNMFAPLDDPQYASLRRSLALSKTAGRRMEAGGVKSAIAPFAASGQFWMNPAMDALYNGAWMDGKLAVVHACGWAKELFGGRSHFEAQQHLSAMSPSFQSAGFMNRFAGQFSTTGLNAIGFGAGAHPAMMGATKSFAFETEDTFDLTGFNDRAKANTALAKLYPASATDLLRNVGAQTLPQVTTIANLPADPGPQNGANYANSFGRELQETARLIRANVGLRSVVIDTHGWDTHGSDVAAGGQLASLANALQAFYADLGPTAMQEVTVVVASEFGRTVRMNDSAGTDHGRGGAVMVMGGKIKGGVYGGFPNSITDGDKDSTGVDTNALPVLNDYRRVFSEVMQVRGGATNLQALFPDYVQQPFLGLAVA